MHGSRTHDLVNIVIGQDEPISVSSVLTNAVQNRTALQTEHHVLLAQRQFAVECLHASTLNPGCEQAGAHRWTRSEIECCREGSPYLEIASGVGNRSGRQVRRLHFSKQDHWRTVACRDLSNQFRASAPVYGAILVGEEKCQ